MSKELQNMNCFGCNAALINEERELDRKGISPIEVILQREEGKIKENYCEFMLQMQSLLQKNDISLNDIILYISMLEPNNELFDFNVQANHDVSSLMREFAKNQRWWNFATSASVAIKFGGDEGFKLVELYEEKLHVYLLKQITLQLPIVFKSNELVIKINRQLKECPKDWVNQFHGKAAELLNMDPIELTFLSAKEGCVELTFLYSSTYEFHIKNVTDIRAQQFQDLKILSILTNG